MLKFVRYLYIFVVLTNTCLSLTCTERKRPTSELKAYFEGRCLHYQEIIYNDPFCESQRNCTELWEVFLEAYAHQPECNVSKERYERFLDLARHTVPPGKAVFWDDVYELVSRYSYSGRRYFTIADTLAGYIADNMTWCSNASESDGNAVYPTRCPAEGDKCPLSPYAAFWTIASRQYAKSTVGEIRIMLNANSGPVFSKNSYFAKEELPHLNGSVVPSAKILLVHDLDTEPKETCSGDSVAMLIGLLKNKGIAAMCDDNPRDVLLLQCSDNPDAQDCKHFDMTASSVSLSAPVTLILVSMFVLFC